MPAPRTRWLRGHASPCPPGKAGMSLPNPSVSILVGGRTTLEPGFLIVLGALAACSAPAAPTPLASFPGVTQPPQRRSAAGRITSAGCDPTAAPSAGEAVGMVRHRRLQRNGSSRSAAEQFTPADCVPTAALSAGEPMSSIRHRRRPTSGSRRSATVSHTPASSGPTAAPSAGDPMGVAGHRHRTGSGSTAISSGAEHIFGLRTDDSPPLLGVTVQSSGDLTGALLLRERQFSHERLFRLGGSSSWSPQL